MSPQYATHYAPSPPPQAGPSAPGQPPFGPPAAGPSPYGPPDPGPSPYGQPAPGQGPYPAQPTGQQPYGQPVYGQAPPGQNPSGQQQYEHQRYGALPAGANTNGGAVAAFVVAIVSFVICGVPVIGVIGGIVGLVLGIVAVRKVSAGTAGGKGFAVAAIVIGAMAVLGGIGSTTASWTATRGITSVTHMPFEGTGQNSGNGSPVEPESSPGRLGSLLDIGSSADVGSFTATVTAVELDAAGLANYDATEIDPGYEYVLVELTVAYNGTTEGVPFATLWPTFVGNDGFEYPAGACSAETSAVGGGRGAIVLNSGKKAAMVLCMEVPTAAVDGGSIAVGSPNAADRAYWSSE